MAGISERIAQRVVFRRKKLGWTATRLAELAAISQPHIWRIENAKGLASEEVLMRVAGALGISVDALIAPESNIVEAPPDLRTIPVLDYVQAGQWTSVDERSKEAWNKESIMTTLDCPPSTFALRIHGDSMYPAFKEGDIVVINPTIQPRPGDFVVAVDENGDATFKQYREIGRAEKNLVIFELVPINQNHHRSRSDQQKISIVGVMIEHRTFRPRS